MGMFFVFTFILKCAHAKIEKWPFFEKKKKHILKRFIFVGKFFYGIFINCSGTTCRQIYLCATIHQGALRRMISLHKPALELFVRVGWGGGFHTKPPTWYSRINVFEAFKRPNNRTTQNIKWDVINLWYIL